MTSVFLSTIERASLAPPQPVRARAVASPAHAASTRMGRSIGSAEFRKPRTDTCDDEDGDEGGPSRQHPAPPVQPAVAVADGAREGLTVQRDEPGQRLVVALERLPAGHAAGADLDGLAALAVAHEFAHAAVAALEALIAQEHVVD